MLHLAGRDMEFDKKILILWLSSGPEMFFFPSVLDPQKNLSENWRAVEGLGKSVF